MERKFQHPTQQTVINYIKMQQQPPNLSLSQGIFAAGVMVGIPTLLYYSYYVATNPTGSLRRQMYDQSLPPLLRFLKKSGPIWVTLALIYGGHSLAKTV